MIRTEIEMERKREMETGREIKRCGDWDSRRKMETKIYKNVQKNKGSLGDAHRISGVNKETV